jgi:hypothetical protein
VEWLTLQDPPQAPQASGDDAVFLDGENEILAARRIKPALTAEDRAQKFLVTAHHSDHRARRQLANPSGEQLQPAAGRRSALAHETLSD